MFTPVNGPASGGRSFAGDHHIAVGDGGLSLLSLGRLLQLIPGGPALGFSRVIGGESGLKPDMAGSPPATSGMKYLLQQQPISISPSRSNLPLK